MRLITRTTLVAAITATAVALAALPAVAAPTPSPTDLPGVKAALTARIDLRLAALDKDKTVIAAAQRLTDADRATLTGVISNDITGLTALKATVAGETNRTNEGVA